MNADVRAAREKNGVYISHERFVKEEAEKKVIYLFSVSAYLHNVTIILLGFFFKYHSTSSRESKTSDYISVNWAFSLNLLTFPDENVYTEVSD